MSFVATPNGPAAATRPPTLRVGVFGCGRLGCNIFRLVALGASADVQLVALADRMTIPNMHYRLLYDSILGRYPGVLSLEGETLSLGSSQVRLLQAQQPHDVPWGELQVDVVIDATNARHPRRYLQQHIDQGAKRVIACLPAEPDDPFDAFVVMGLNHLSLKPSDTIIGHGSVTAHAALPLITTLNREFGVEQLFYTAVHAYSSEQRLADVPASTLRRSRAAAENIVPDTGSCTTLIEHVLPALQGKVRGMSLKVPVANGSLVDVVSWTRQAVSVAMVNDAICAAASGALRDLIEYNTDALVSSDVRGSNFVCTFDALSTMVLNEHMVKTLAWYDNGWGYARQTLELARALHTLAPAQPAAPARQNP